MGVGFGVGYGVWFPPPANVTDETKYSRAKVTLARFIVSLLQLLVEFPIVCRSRLYEFYEDINNDLWTYMKHPIDNARCEGPFTASR